MVPAEDLRGAGPQGQGCRYVGGMADLPKNGTSPGNPGVLIDQSRIPLDQCFAAPGVLLSRYYRRAK